MPGAGKETEIKLAVRDLAGVRRKLRRHGFRVVQPRAFEENTLFDEPSETLRRNDCLLRLRSARGRHWITFKGPAEKARGFKVRPEVEAGVADARAVRALLGRLGFEAGFRYQKFRTVLAGRGQWAGGLVTLDETPIGNYVELEGKRAWIRRVARLLGFGPKDFITKSYLTLYAAWCRREGRPQRDMIFRRRRRVSS